MGQSRSETSCLFCNIITGDVDANIIFRNKDVIAFTDINPQAPVHILIIPKKEIKTLNHLKPEDQEIAGKMVLLAKDLAKEHHIDETGYRTIFNCNDDGGQTVFHIHLHFQATGATTRRDRHWKQPLAEK